MNQIVKPNKDTAELSFYTYLHQTRVQYDKFKELVEKRVKILRRLESSPLDPRLLNFNTKEEDVLSHFFCRLVCSQTLSTAKWFITVETFLFKTRVNKNLKETMDFWFKSIRPHIKNTKKENDILILTPESHYDPDFESSESVNYKKVHFKKIADLIGRRKMIPKMGYCDMTDECVKSLLVTEFKCYLEKQVNELMEKNLTYYDERLHKLCMSMIMSPVCKPYDKNFSHKQDEKYYPLCIQAIISRLKERHHIKYNDRQTLCLFLKDCGMSLENCISFFKNNFNVSPDIFNKEYLYSIRHNYGLEGKRANYPCFNCSKIANLAVDNKSLCPFIKDGSDGKKMIIESYPELDIEDVYNTPSYTQRCKNMLEHLSNSKFDVPIISPIRYYTLFKKSKTQNIDEKNPQPQ